jgi:dienelactone hydrolase
MIAVGLLLALVLTSGAAPLVSSGSPLGGDWAGWAYFEGDQGDAPLRLRVYDTADGVAVRYDNLAGRQYDLPCRLITWDPPHVVLERVSPSGRRTRLEGDLHGDSLQGRITGMDFAGTFELVRSAAPISRTAPESFADAQGYYAFDTAPLEITSRPWGELLYTDFVTGRQGTLFPVDRDTFFVGSAMYVPRPAESGVRFVRDADGTIQEMRWSGPAGVRRGMRTRIEEQPVTFSSGDVRLAGTILRPAGPAAPRPAAVVLGGSNWKSRSDARRDAEILASLGITTLVFDRRGHGESGGAAVHAFADDAADALAAARLLRAQPDVRGDRVGVTGRSQGGWIAPLAASMEPEVAFLILFVPPAVSPAAQEATRRDHALEDAGLGKAARTHERRMLERGWTYASTGKGWRAYLDARGKARDAGVPENELGPTDPDHEDWDWDRLNWQYDPIPALQRVRCPVLTVFGGADRNVVPEIHVPRMQAAFAKAGNREVTIVIVPGANHGLVALPPGAKTRPLHRQTAIGTQGWPEVRRWIEAALPPR